MTVKELVLSRVTVNILFNPAHNAFNGFGSNGRVGEFGKRFFNP